MFILSELFIFKLHIIRPKRQISVFSHADRKDTVHGLWSAKREWCSKLPCTQSVSVICFQLLGAQAASRSPCLLVFLVSAVLVTAGGQEEAIWGLLSLLPRAEWV